MHERIVINHQEIGMFGSQSVRVVDGKPSYNRFVGNKVVLIDSVQLMDATIASGRPDVYNYIELSNIPGELAVADEKIIYQGSRLEDLLLGFFSGLLGKADLLHVEYQKDKETYRQLLTGVPAPLSRLGFKLFNLGFTWFKDWYIAEGWREGPVKLTAEKPLDEEMVFRNLTGIKKEVVDYLSRSEVEQIRQRAEQVFKGIDKLLENPSVIL